MFTAVGLAAAPMLLVFVQPDFGTALVYARAPSACSSSPALRWTHLAAPRGRGALSRSSSSGCCPRRDATCSKPYQVERLVGFLNPDIDPGGTTYNVNQSITAVGSGGSTAAASPGRRQTNLDFLPEHATDFVFASLAEQRGFLGAAILLVLYLLVVWRGMKVVAVAREPVLRDRRRRDRRSPSCSRSSSTSA